MKALCALPLALISVLVAVPTHAADMALPTIGELINAVVADNAELISAILVDSPALVRATDKNGATALHHAAAAKKATWAAEVLIFNKANVNARKPDGVTPLHVACATENAQIAKLLLSHGARQVADKKGRTPRSIAAASGNRWIANLLEREWMPPHKPVISKNAKDGSTMVVVPAGKFTMGGDIFDQEGPVHKVQLDAFRIGRYEITVAQYRAFCKETGREMPGEPEWGWIDDHPMVNVTWQDAADYCTWAGGRLPTEAEWEKAARGTDERFHPWGEDSCVIESRHKTRCNMNIDGQSADIYENTSPVGKFAYDVSPYGCLDMGGNVAEWCSDKAPGPGIGYGKDPAGGWVNPKGPAEGSFVMVRGGSFTITNDIGIRCTYRGVRRPNTASEEIGFRLAIQ